MIVLYSTLISLLVVLIGSLFTYGLNFGLDIYKLLNDYESAVKENINHGNINVLELKHFDDMINAETDIDEIKKIYNDKMAHIYSYMRNKSLNSDKIYRELDEKMAFSNKYYKIYIYVMSALITLLLLSFWWLYKACRR